MPLPEPVLIRYLSATGDSSSRTSLLGDSSSPSLIYPRSRTYGRFRYGRTPGRWGNRSSSGMHRARGTKEMSTARAGAHGPRGQYTGWRMAAIRSNETVGKCILARARATRCRKGGDLPAFSLSPPPPFLAFPLFPRQRFVRSSLFLSTPSLRFPLA